jgi:hypothetical protein
VVDPLFLIIEALSLVSLFFSAFRGSVRSLVNQLFKEQAFILNPPLDSIDRIFCHA